MHLLLLFSHLKINHAFVSRRSGGVGGIRVDGGGGGIRAKEGVEGMRGEGRSCHLEARLRAQGEKMHEGWG